MPFGKRTPMNLYPRTKESLLPPLWVVFLLLLAATVWIAVELKELVVLLVVGYCISYLIEPLLGWLERRKVPRSRGFFLLLFAGLGAIVILALTAVPTLVRQYDALSESLPRSLEALHVKFRHLVEMVRARAPQGLVPPEQIFTTERLVAFFQSDTVRGVAAGFFAALFQGYSLALTLMNLFLLPFFVFYISLDFPGLHERILGIFPSSRRERVREIGTEVNGYVSAFVRGQLTVGAILSVLYAIGLKVVGLELWLLLALISGFGNLVPYLGTLVGITLSTLMALVSFGDLWHVGAVWVVFAVVQALEGTVITPRVLGNTVGLSPLVIILAIVAGGSLFGLLGLFLAVPAAAALRVLGKYFRTWIVQHL